MKPPTIHNGLNEYQILLDDDEKANFQQHIWTG
jgi:hypothetical protein